MNQKTKKSCSFPGCDKPHCAKGLCNSHWAQKSRGQELTKLLNRESAEERFFRQTIIPEDKANDCWIFTGNGKGSGKSAKIDGIGYGQLYSKGRKCMAHRFSYELHKGKIPEGYQLDHLCRVKNCVNPNHLQIVTQDENLRRMNFSKSLKKRIEYLESFLISKGFDPKNLK